MVGCATMPRQPINTGARLALLGVAVLAIGVSVSSAWVSSDGPKRLDPAAWGGDHVGKPVPEYVTGEECLFCHRQRAGATWHENRHHLTIHEVDDMAPALTALKTSPANDVAAEVKLLLGNKRRQRFLKPATAYGKLEMLSVAWSPPRENQPGRLISMERPHWDAVRFGAACAGCHATAVEPKEQAFSAISLDCYVCHGNVPAEHPNKPELAYLSPRRKEDARVVTSICASCHVRTGSSKSTGRPYPNNFVAGDNLFRDFVADLTDQAMNNLSTADRHVLENVRDVVVFGKENVTCLNCHNIHGRSSTKHRLAAKSDLCLNCHNATGPKRNLKPFSDHSKICGY